MEGARREIRETGNAGSPLEGGGNGHPAWLWPNLLSLDAPAVAVLWQWLFAFAAGVVMPLMTHVLLAVAVWVIYVGDRLLDAARLDETLPATARHRFCRRHWKGFLGSVIVIAVLGAVAVPYSLPEGLVARGLFLALLVAGYFVSVELMRRYRKIVIPKEILCGIIFAIGTNLSPAFYLSNQDAGGFASPLSFFLEGLLGLGEAVTPPVMAFMVLCSLNCALIAVWESSADTAQDPAAMTHAARARDVPFARVFALLIVVSLILMMREWGGAAAVIYACIAVSAVGLWILKRKEGSFSRPSLRTLADAALLTPLGVLPFVL